MGGLKTGNAVVIGSPVSGDQLKSAGGVLIQDGGGLGSGIIMAITCSIPGSNPANETVVADEKAAFGYTINSILGATTSSGSITLAVKINGTSVTGLSAISITSTPADSTASASNIVNAGDKVTWVFTGNSSANDVAFTMKLTRT